ncbi:MAG: PEP-CTERM sorting domain-containing protein [Phycisphaerales bacterium]|nr:PEP-CTERM sorting domain-containing protein [Phycisphaerales bacterium]
MRVLRVSLALVLALAFTSKASAVNQIWFETADGLNGGPGQVLELAIDTSGGPSVTNFDIVAKANIDQTDWLGFSIDLRGAAGDAGKLSASNWANASPFTQQNADGVGGDAPNLMTGGSHFNFIGGAGGAIDLFTFTLTKNKNQGDTNISEIEFVVGALEFGQDDFVNPIPDFDVAGNGLIDGAGGTSGGTVIRITNVPEPATFALLGFGAIALIRRRR